MGQVTEKHLKKVVALSEELGYAGAARELGVKAETIRRRVREWKQRTEVERPEPIDDNILRQMAERFTPAEMRQMLSSSKINPDHRTAIHNFDGEEVCFGAITDTHLGSKYTDVSMLEEAFEKFEQAGVDFICHCGDVHEGLSHRAGHWFECTHMGYSAQLGHSREVFSQWQHTPIYMIDGNHDRWYIKSNGALIVEELCRDQDNLIYLGHDEGDIDLGPVTMKLWHGEDGSSYAYSYRIQKIVESFTGGEKPNILVCGHTHKALYTFDRHVHCISAGAMQKQSKWMRSKKHASHTGFYIVRMGVNDQGVAWFEPRFYPFYQ